MNALFLGLVAALCWAFHDICVRFLSQRTPMTACIFVVLLTGLIFHLGIMGIAGGFKAVPAKGAWFSVGAGVCFVIATFGVYAAFQRGPVRLVAPLIAGYPILSVAFAASQGVSITSLEWVAVFAIAIGVALVAALSDVSVDAVPPKGPTIFFAVTSALGFAGTFALGHHAAANSDEMPTTLVTRLVALGLTVTVLLVFKQSFWPGKRALPMLVAMGVADGIALYCVLSAGGLPDAQYAAVAASMFGLLTILLAWALLREKMSLPQWLGCLIAFCGIGYLAS